jgi:hypothetical protein
MIVEFHIHVSNFWFLFWFIGSVALDVGDMTEALKKFESCWHLRHQCLYRSHRDLTTCVDQVAKCYSMLGKTSFSQHHSVLCKLAEEISTQNLCFFFFSYFLPALSSLLTLSPSTPDDGGRDSLEMSNTERLNDLVNPLQYDDLNTI